MPAIMNLVLKHLNLLCTFNSKQTIIKNYYKRYGGRLYEADHFNNN